jgi:hypothetical protein
MTVEAIALPNAIELNFSSASAGSEEKLGDHTVIWKDILREGDFAILPGAGKKTIPFRVVPSGESSAGDATISMADLCESFEERAFEDVTIPDGHPKKDDSALNNTGYVEGLRVIKKKGKHYLQGALGFTEPEAAGKVKRGSVPNVSSGIFFNFLRKHDGKRFRAALNHVALTKTPWINDLDPFKRVYASDDSIEYEGELTVMFAEQGEEDNSGDKAEIVWNEQDGTNWLREALQAALTPDQPIDPDRPHIERPYYSVEDLSQSKGLALVSEFYKGDRSRWVVPFSVDGDSVSAAPQLRWTQGRDALVAASDDDDGDRIEFGELSSGKIKDKLNVALGDMEGSDNLRVEEVALDSRAMIVGDSKIYLADFVSFADGSVLLSPSDDWEAISVPGPKADATQPAPAPASKKVVSLYDKSTPEGRVAAARQARRQGHPDLYANSH